MAKKKAENVDFEGLMRKVRTEALERGEFDLKEVAVAIDSLETREEMEAAQRAVCNVLREHRDGAPNPRRYKQVERLLRQPVDSIQLKMNRLALADQIKSGV